MGSYEFVDGKFNSIIKKDGPEIAFRLLYDNYGKPIEGYVCRCLRAMDCIDLTDHKCMVTGDTFLKASKLINQYYEGTNKRGFENPPALLCVIAKNKISEHISGSDCRDSYTKMTVPLDDLEYLLLAKESPANQIYYEKQISTLLFRAINGLFPTHRNAMEDMLAGSDHWEIAEKRGISVIHSRNNRYWALRCLRSALIKLGIDRGGKKS